MIRKLLVSSFILGLLIVPLYPVYAADSTTAATTRTVKPVSTTKIDDRIQKVEDKKASVSAKLDGLRERIASRAAALKAKLAKFRDKAKAQRVDRINTELTNINKNRTDEMSQRLDRILEILNKLETRVADSSSSANTSDIQGTILAAKTQITNSKAAVASQSAQDYTIQVSSESGVKKDAMNARDELHNDLKTTQEQVLSAKQAVLNAIKTVMEVLGGTH